VSSLVFDVFDVFDVLAVYGFLVTSKSKETLRTLIIAPQRSFKKKNHVIKRDITVRQPVLFDETLKIVQSVTGVD